MPTLKNVTSETRSILKYGGVILSVLLFVFIFVRIGFLAKDFFFPTPPPPPSVAFGKVHMPILPKNKTNTKTAYFVDTLSGTLPTFPDRIKIYNTIRAKPALFSFENMQRKVANLGFNSQAVPLSADTYQWQTQKPITKRLTVNIFSSDFTFSTSFIKESQTQPFLLLSDQNSAKNSAVLLIESLTSIPEDLDMAKTKTSLFTIQSQDIVPVTHISQAKIIKVDFFQKDVDGIAIYYPNTTTMSMLLGKVEGELAVAEGEFLHQSIASEGSTYPIKTASEAFDELKNGNAYVDSNPDNSTNISIKKVTLGYFLGELKQDYLWPVIVFEDNKGFIAFVSTIRDEWVSK